MTAPVFALALLVGMLPQDVDPAPEQVPGASIRGSPESMREQHRVALEHDLPFFRTEEEIREATQQGLLVELPGNPDYEVADFVHLPYVIPEARLFIERTAALYRQACGEPLVVTSGVRAIEEQPPNAHDLSVHPAGMAVDLRVSSNPACTEWLENKMLALEQQGLLNGIREFHPPHYHVAIYPSAYREYVQAQQPEDEPIGEPVDPRRPPFGAAGVVLVFVLLLLAFLLISRRNARNRADPPEDT